MPLSKTRRTILVIDDDPTNLRVAVEYLRAYSYEILIARDGATGIERAQRAQPDLILLDVQMPGIDGYETCRRLAANPDTGDTPVIFMTALSSVDHRVRGFEAGAVDYVQKPVEERELLARVRTHLQLRALQQELETQQRLLTDQVALQRERALEADARREQDQREREKLRELARWQSEQLLQATRQRVDASRGGATHDAGLLGLLRGHLEEARRLAATQPQPGPLLEPLQDQLAMGLELVAQLERGALHHAPSAPPPVPEDNPLTSLSDRELEIVTLLVKGLSNKEIAYDLGLARTTISTHRKRILAKLGVQDLSSLIKLALRHGVES